MKKIGFFCFSMAFLVLITFMVSCKKETVPTSHSYTLSPIGTSIINGTLTATKSNERTAIHLVLDNTIANSPYEIHFHEGPPNNYSGYAPIFFSPIEAGHHQLVLDTVINMTFDSFYYKYDATCVVHYYPSGPALTRGGIGKNR